MGTRAGVAHRRRADQRSARSGAKGGRTREMSSRPQHERARERAATGGSRASGAREARLGSERPRYLPLIAQTTEPRVAGAKSPRFGRFCFSRIRTSDQREVEPLAFLRSMRLSDQREGGWTGSGHDRIRAVGHGGGLRPMRERSCKRASLSRRQRSCAAPYAGLGLRTCPEKTRGGSRRSRLDAVPVKESAETDASATRQEHLSRRLYRLP